MSFLRRIWPWRGGDAGVTVPPMDGALRPNRLLQDAAVRANIAAPDNLVSHDGAVLFSSGNVLMRLTDGGVEAVERFDAPVTALAAGPDGLTVALGNGTLLQPGGTMLDGGPWHVTALAQDGDALLVATGSERHAPTAWKHDLMERNATGAVWRLEKGGRKPQCLASGLRWVAGLCPTQDGVLIAESWAHRLALVPRGGGRARCVLDDLPGYPGRVVADGDGYWLCIFAPRGQLTEFVLKEDAFRAAMMAQVHPDHWVSPALNSGRDFLEPLHLGGIRVMGQIKPWAPTRSCGLVVKLDADFQPVASAHSRTDGDRHGATSVLAADGELLVAARGGDAILALDVASMAGGVP